MATTSLLTSVKSTLVTTLAARPALSGVTVAYAWPGPDARVTGIYLGESRGGFEPVGLKAGRRQREERWEIDCIVYAYRQAETAQGAEAAEAAAFALLDEIDDELADDPCLGLAVRHVQLTDDASVDLVPYEDGWGCVITQPITFEARLT